MRILRLTVPHGCSATDVQEQGETKSTGPQQKSEGYRLSSTFVVGMFAYPYFHTGAGPDARSGPSHID